MVFPRILLPVLYYKLEKTMFLFFSFLYMFYLCWMLSQFYRGGIPSSPSSITTADLVRHGFRRRCRRRKRVVLCVVMVLRIIACAVVPSVIITTTTNRMVLLVMVVVIRVTRVVGWVLLLRRRRTRLQIIFTIEIMIRTTHGRLRSIQRN